MKAALREDECPSVPELSRRLGYQRYERLYQVDPVLCRRITARHRACTRTHWWKQPGAKRICEIDVIRSALEQSLAQDPPVSVRRIAMHLGYANGGLIQRKFPDLCHAIAQKLEDCRKRRFVTLQASCGCCKSRRSAADTSRPESASWLPELIDIAVMVSRRDGPGARSKGTPRATGNSKASSSTTRDSARRVSSIAQQRCPSALLISFEFGREVSRPLSRNTVAVPAGPERADARARAVAERRGLPDREAPPRKGADSDGTPHYEFSEQGLAQTMGSRASRCQEG